MTLLYISYYIFIHIAIITFIEGHNLSGGEYLGWVLPYLGLVGRFHGDDPRLGDFQSDWFIFCASSQFDRPLLPAEKKAVCLDHI